MDSIQNLRTFVAVAESASLVGAGRRLGVVASVVTKRIDQLEWRVRAPLFTRSTRRVALTALGSRHLPAARQSAESGVLPYGDDCDRRLAHGRWFLHCHGRRQPFPGRCCLRYLRSPTHAGERHPKPQHHFCWATASHPVTVRS